MTSTGSTPPTGRGFNEAAGIPRGRRVFALAWVRDVDAASMRPRVFPAEDGLTGADVERELALQ